MKRKKEHAVLLHILFVILVVTGISIMYNNPHYGEGISWLTNETYEDTPEFIRQFKTDIDDIFNYIKYKEVFESNGKLAYDKPVVRVTTGRGEVQEYTVDEMVRMAKSMGYYLNEKFKVPLHTGRRRTGHPGGLALLRPGPSGLRARGILYHHGGPGKRSACPCRELLCISL